MTGKAKVTKVGAAGGTSYQVDYEFTTAMGNVQTGSGFLPFGVWESVGEGGTLPVKYLADDPGTNEPVAQLGRRGRTTMLIGLGIGGALLAVGGLILMTSWLGIRRKTTLLLHGTRCAAEIREWHPEHGVVTYAYHDSTGSEHVHKIQAARGIQSARNVGDRFVVCVDLSRPESHVVDMLGVHPVESVIS